MPDGPVHIEPPKPISVTEVSQPVQPPVLVLEKPQSPIQQPDIGEIIKKEAEARLQQEIDLQGLGDIDQQTRLAQIMGEVKAKYTKPEDTGKEEDHMVVDSTQTPEGKSGVPAQPATALAGAPHTPETAVKEKTIEEKKAEYRKHWGQGDDSALGHLINVDWNQMTIPDEKKVTIKAVQTQYKALDLAVRESRARSENGVYYIKDAQTGEETPFIQTEKMVETVLAAEDILAADTTNQQRATEASENAKVLRENLTGEGFFKARTAEEKIREKEIEKNNEADKEMENIYIDTVLDIVGHPKGKDGKEVDVIVFKRKPDNTIDPGPDGRPVILEFHPELLEGTTDVFLAGTTHLFAASLVPGTPGTSEDQKHNIMAMHYKHIQIRNPDRLQGFSGAEIMNNRLNNKMGKEFLSWIHGIDNRVSIPAELSDATMGDLVNILSFASACQRGKLITLSSDRQRHVLSDRAVKAYNELFKNKNPYYENFVITLASDETQDHAGNFLSQQFNINSESLATEAGRTTDVDSVIKEVARRKGLSTEEQTKYKEILHHMASDKHLEELAKKLGLPSGMGMWVIGIAMFLPMIQGVMDTGGGGGEERGGGGQ